MKYHLYAYSFNSFNWYAAVSITDDTRWYSIPFHNQTTYKFTSRTDKRVLLFKPDSAHTYRIYPDLFVILPEARL